MTKKTLPANAGAERKADLRNYFVGLLRDHFSSKSEVLTLSGLRRLRDALVGDLGWALEGIGLPPATAVSIATEAVAGALAKKGVAWVMGKINGAGGGPRR